MEIIEVGQYVTITRKPQIDEPFSNYWLKSMDAYLGSTGILIKVGSGSYMQQGGLFIAKYLTVKHWDLTVATYPAYCLVPYQGAITFGGCCSCKTETLIARGCRCGAFAREKVKK